MAGLSKYHAKRRFGVTAEPRGKVGKRPRPLVVVLHGCRQDNRDIEAITGFNELADRHGFLVAYPFVTSYRGMRNRNCWGWWLESEIRPGAGEVEDARPGRIRPRPDRARERGQAGPGHRTN